MRFVGAPQVRIYQAGHHHTEDCTMRVLVISLAAALGALLGVLQATRPRRPSQREREATEEAIQLQLEKRFLERRRREVDEYGEAVRPIHALEDEHALSQPDTPPGIRRGIVRWREVAGAP